MILGNTHITSKLTLDTLPASSLFIGPEGVGKRTFAEFLLKDIKAPQKKILLEPNIADIRALVTWSLVSYFGNKIKYAIVDFSRAQSDTQNALLKLLEEPPNRFKLIIIGRPRSTLPTIISRCHRFFFHPLRREEVTDILTGLRYSYEDAATAADYADGSVSAALKYVDRLAEQRQALSIALSLDSPAAQAQAILHIKEADPTMLVDVLTERKELSIQTLALLSSRGGVRGKLLLSRILGL